MRGGSLQLWLRYFGEGASIHGVDINPYRNGYYMSGTGHKIVGPDFLQEYRPDVVIVMNEIYCDEIRTLLREKGLEPEIVAL